MQLQQPSIRNQVLSTLGLGDFELLRDRLEPVRLEFQHFLIEPNGPIRHVFFPQSGIASMLADTSEGRIEVGIIGREGMVGLAAVLGIDRSVYGFMVQAVGEALRIGVDDLLSAVRQSPSLQGRFMRYAHVHMMQTAQTAYANAGFALEARLARWILMTHDRTDGDELTLTHEFLSMMLGVRRPGVTVALQVLEGNRLIRAQRGRVTVLNRAGLEEVADDAYGTAEAEYARVMAEP